MIAEPTKPTKKWRRQPVKIFYQVDEEFRNYLPKQRPEETDALRCRLLAEGCKPGAMTVARIGNRAFLIDGHHTRDICIAEGIHLPDPITMRFLDRDEAKAWMRQNQLARRNLTDEKFTYLLGEEFNARKQSHGGDRKRDGSIRQNDGLIGQGTGSTAEQLAEEHGVSPSTVERAGDYAAAVNAIAEQNPEAKETILSGATGATKQQVIAATNLESLLCRPCRTSKSGPKKGCKGCKAFRAQKAQAGQQGRETGDDEPVKRKVPTKNGRPIFDWREFDKHYSEVMRFPENVASAHPTERECPEFEKASRLLNELAEVVAEWQKKLRK